ncbi:uncharacterized protein BDZ99DRAFT_574890 [Mytilinidion resinicola]|uniref:UBX domain-containing protein 2 n=1 Tax=Mytilinidion resinicola TaxID=574789 RepID=A0A6A6YBS8_9PEZI|nr:uncharacterized protein BDZ99DRAFT_574890 [Mytilinidion resinicola]KAF2805297.1 hypothetical protein BDZ99DRAFT_574890 [Mytilinidion resinicola]
MFHQGDLQSGIALAIQQSKSVACFVRDDNEESELWEANWLQDEDVSSLLAQSTVLLRMQAGSTEAGFLAAFCPLKNIPTLVVIHNGQLREHLTGGDEITKEEFTARLRAVLSPQVEPTATQPQAEPATAVSSAPSTSNPAPQAPQTTPSTPSTPANPPAVISLLADRAARLEQDKRAKEAAEATARAAARTAAKGKAKALDAEIAGAASSTRAAQLSAAAQARKRKEDEKSELRRIQALIDNDKAERKARGEERKKAAVEQRRLAAGGAPSEDVDPTEASPSPRASGKGKATRRLTGAVHLNIRLFDGGTIRQSFPHDAMLQTVREWIDQELLATESKHPPYTFKHLLPPAPSRALSASDEAAELADIDLAPSATLVLVPVTGYTEAYTGGAGGGVLGSVVGSAKGVVGSAFGVVGGVLGYVTGYGAQAQAPASSSAPQGDGDGRGTGEARGDGRVRTLADQRQEGGAERRSERDRQFYNGNQTNFEPRRDEGKDD